MDLEREKLPKASEETVEEIPTEIPEEVEAKEGIKAVRTQITAKVEDDEGKPLMESPVTKVTSVEIPRSEETLEAYSRGDTEDAKTWWGASFLRLIKKALHFGWKILGKQ